MFASQGDKIHNIHEFNMSHKFMVI